MNPSRINPDSRAVLVVATVATALLALVSFLLSFNGLADAAAWANVPGWLAWAIPAYVDGAILVYTVAALVFRARGESARIEWTALGVFAALSVAANGVHAWTTAPTALQTFLGVLLAALAPVSVLLTTHTIARLVVAPPTAPSTALGMDDPDVEVGHVPALAASQPKPSVEWLHLRDRVLTTPGDGLLDVVDHQEPATAPVPITDTETRNARIRELDAQGDMSLRAIAAAVGCSKSTVSRILGRLDDRAA